MTGNEHKYSVFKLKSLLVSGRMYRVLGHINFDIFVPIGSNVMFLYEVIRAEETYFDDWQVEPYDVLDLYFLYGRQIVRLWGFNKYYDFPEHSMFFREIS